MVTVEHPARALGEIDLGGQIVVEVGSSDRYDAGGSDAIRRIASAACTMGMSESA